MSSYSGGVSITQVSAFNSNPNTMRRARVIGSVRIFGANNTVDYDNSVGDFFTAAKGPDGVSIVPPANIAAGFNLLSTTGKGFIGAIFLPKFAVAGSATLTIIIDGITHIFPYSWAAIAQRGLLTPDPNVGSLTSVIGGDYRGGDVLSPASAGVWPLLSDIRIKSVSDYVAAKVAIRFETDITVRISSATATDASASCLVQVIKDYS